MNSAPLSLAGSSGEDSPCLTGWGSAVLSGDQENVLDTYERLRREASPPDFEAYAIPKEARSSFYLAMGEYLYSDSHGMWLPPESKDGHCDPDELVFRIGERMDALCQLFDPGNGRPQSPIEAMLGASLLWLHMDYTGFPSVDCFGGPEGQKAAFGDFGPLAFHITGQASIAKYRVDFLLWFSMGKHVAGVVVECDGHDWHERTKEQASKDKSRDRELLTLGFPVMRFTGSEVFKDSLGCTEQLREALFTAMERVAKDGGHLNA